MAVILPPENPQNPATKPSPLSKLVQKLKLRRRPSKKGTGSSSSADQLPRDPRPPLIASPLPLVLPEHQHTLPYLGWTTVTFPTPTPSSAPQAQPNTDDSPPPPPDSTHPLQLASTALFAAAQLFFDQPDSAKAAWKHRLGTEEGWSKVEGEKEFITLRSLAYTPEVLREPAARYWELVAGREGGYLGRVLGSVEGSLGLPVPVEENEDQGAEAVWDGGAVGETDVNGTPPSQPRPKEQPRKPAPNPLLQFLPPTPSLPETDAEKTSSMIRIFRYTISPPPSSNPPASPDTPPAHPQTVVAEPHADLGLLSLVTGDVPGLEVWTGHRFADIEAHYARNRIGAATLLAGRQLEMLSNGRYVAGPHRVVSYPPTSSPSRPAKSEADGRDVAKGEQRFRHSIVFVLRAHEPVVLDSAALESSVTGVWERPEAGERTMGEVYAEIRGRHWNVNIGKEERERQRRGVQEGRMKKADGGVMGKGELGVGV